MVLALAFDMLGAKHGETPLAIHKIEIGKRIKGALMEDEAWWHLCHDTSSNEFWVEHSWDRVDAYNVKKPANVGTKRIAVQGYDGPGNENVQTARATLLEQAGA